MLLIALCLLANLWENFGTFLSLNILCSKAKYFLKHQLIYMRLNGHDQNGFEMLQCLKVYNAFKTLHGIATGCVERIATKKKKNIYCSID